MDDYSPVLTLYQLLWSYLTSSISCFEGFCYFLILRTRNKYALVFISKRHFGYFNINHVTLHEPLSMRGEVQKRMQIKTWIYGKIQISLIELNQFHINIESTILNLIRLKKGGKRPTGVKQTFLHSRNTKNVQ